MKRIGRVLTCFLLLPILAVVFGGIQSSNESQPEQYDPIMDAALSGLSDPTVVSSGLIAKIFLVPMGFAIGTIMILIAGPIFGGSWLAARSPRYQNLARRLTKNEHEDLSAFVGLSIAVSIFGLILILIGSVRQSPLLNAVGGVAVIIGLLCRGQVESVRVAARNVHPKRRQNNKPSLADMTVTEGQYDRNNDDSDNASASSRTGRTHSHVEDPVFKVPDTARAWYENFVHSLIDAHGQTLAIIRSRITQLDFEKMNRPVQHGRKFLLTTFMASEQQRLTTPNIQNLNASIRCFDSGCVHPDSDEWIIDGPEIGRGHACLYGGIARTFARHQSPYIMIPDAEKADAWFATAVIIFLEHNDPMMAGRAFQEWGESRRLMGDYEHADSLFFAAYISFVDGGNTARARTALTRHKSRQACSVDSSFFLNRPPTPGETDILTTILGGKNSEQFYSSVK